ncbi:MAG: 30S ribosomal protein S7 [Candidatus Spechtbacteria bacterium]|nr:30S ribosomal protein S7 [Candidatus Spechtbacteria bacterium]
MRKSNIAKRVASPDPKFNNPTIGKFINYIMVEGKKSVARRVVYGAFDIIAEKTKKDPIEIFDEALKNAAPLMELKSRRVGGANYQVPLQVRGERRSIIAMKWIINAAQAKKGAPMAKKLSDELMAAARNEGAAIKKKEDTHRMAQANRAFSHFA